MHRRCLHVWILLILGLPLVVLPGFFNQTAVNGEPSKQKGRAPATGEPMGDLQLEEELRRAVHTLAETIGERHVGKPDTLRRAEAWIAGELGRHYNVRKQVYEVETILCANLEVEIAGAERPGEIVVIGAHYDSVPGSPGADDNASGVSALLALTRRFASSQPQRTLRFVAFVNEEPPHFQTETMGSLVYARRCQANEEDVVGMISLESMGYYSDEKKSQKYPALLSAFYPNTGNFLAFVGNPKSKKFVKWAKKQFAAGCRLPAESGAYPAGLPGIGWSDHWAFWQAGYRAFMVTDTAPFRNPHYHQDSDTADQLDYARLAEAVLGMEKVIHQLTMVGSP